MLRACIVNLKDDPSTAIRGVLWAQRGEWLVFRDCSLLKAATTPTKIDGEVIIPRANVAFLQVVA